MCYSIKNELGLPETGAFFYCLLQVSDAQNICDNSAKEDKMKLWIEDEGGRKIECDGIKEIRDANSVLFFETSTPMRDKEINDFQQRMKEMSGHECILLDRNIKLAAAVSSYVKR